jgi:hypothetical protein
MNMHQLNKHRIVYRVERTIRPSVVRENNTCKNGDVVAQLAKARLGEPDCNAAVPGSIPASSTVS